MSHSNNSSDAPICNTTESSVMNIVNNMKDPAQTELPTVMTFKDLHVPESLEEAKGSLKGKSGIYCIRHIATEKIYIGQAQDIFVRIIQHINGSTNTHLKHALSLYSLEAFEFLVVEFVTDTSLLTTREQEHLDWLFSLPEHLRYNYCPTAGSTLGRTLTTEHKTAISAAKLGTCNF
jgi:predicted GIY-YIG superfamily endonuclease